VRGGLLGMGRRGSQASRCKGQRNHYAHRQ
jgi:hypothetical protein